MPRFYVFNRNDEDAVEAVRKVSEQARPGRFIALSEAEYEAFQCNVMCVEFDWPLPTPKGEANDNGINKTDPKKG